MSVVIAFATIDQITLLEKLYQSVFIPTVVKNELKLSSDMPGAKRLHSALEKGIIQVDDSKYSGEAYQQLLLLLDQGEVEAILLAESLANTSGYQFLLINERKGRMVAQHRGLVIAGMGAILLAAKKREKRLFK